MRFSVGLLPWLEALAERNDRAWFQANKGDYEALVRQPALRFIHALAPHLATLAPQVRVDERSLFRIQRDTRFSHDKSPYKTHVGLHFRHLYAADVHAPGFYLHLAPAARGDAPVPSPAEGPPDAGCWFGAGLWMPDGPTTRRLRAHLLAHPSAWQERLDAVARGGLNLDGPRLVRPPPGTPPGHPLTDVVRLKSFVVSAPMPLEVLFGDDTEVDDAVTAFVQRCEAAAPLLEGLCEALDLPW